MQLSKQNEDILKAIAKEKETIERTAKGRWVICNYCQGEGWTTEHDPPASHSPEDGTCISCPVQEGCDKCKTTGKILKEELQVSEEKPSAKTELLF